MGMILAGFFLLVSGIGLARSHRPRSRISGMMAGLFPTGLKVSWQRCRLPSSPLAAASWSDLAAGEAEQPERSLPRAVNGVIVRILIFYIGALTRHHGPDPLAADRADGKPFCTGLHTGRSARDGRVINLVLISAVMSSCNSGLFAGARTLQSLAVRRHAPAPLARIDDRGVPALGISVSAAMMFCGVILNYFVPGKVMEDIISRPPCC